MSIQIRRARRPPCSDQDLRNSDALSVVRSLSSSSSSILKWSINFSLDRTTSIAPREMHPTFLLIIIHFFPPRIRQILKLEKSTKSGGVCLIIKNPTVWPCCAAYCVLIVVRRPHKIPQQQRVSGYFLLLWLHAAPRIFLTAVQSDTFKHLFSSALFVYITFSCFISCRRTRFAAQPRCSPAIMAERIARRVQRSSTTSTPLQKRAPFHFHDLSTPSQQS